MTTINFTTPTLIDPRAWSVMGLHAKDSDTPIGYFGTGLKYAIAVLLRNDHSIVIHVGTDVYRFTLARSTFRGADYDQCQVSLNDQPPTDLPFTTNLGRNWQLWQAYRELHANTLDERGTIDDAPTPKIDHQSTVIRVTGHGISRCYAERSTIFLDTTRQPLITGETCHIYKGRGLFHAGVKASNNEVKTLFAYNVFGCKLSDERLVDLFEARHEIERTIIDAPVPFIINIWERTAKAEYSAFFESRFTWYIKSSNIMAAGRRCMRDNPSIIPATVQHYLKTEHADQLDTVIPDDLQARKLDRIKTLIEPHCHVDIQLARFNVEAQSIVKDGTVYLNVARLDNDARDIAAAIIYHNKAGDDPITFYCRLIRDYLLAK